MARLPTIQDMGPRPVLRPQRGTARVTQAGAVGEEVARLGADVNAIGDQIYEREATAAAKERDTYVSEQIRSLLYDPETGYMGRKGRDAATIRADMDAQLKRLEKEALKGLNNGATDKLQPMLARRLESARLTMDQHAMGARQDWILGASDARVRAASQDAIFDFGRTEESLATIRMEIREQARIQGWSTEETEQRLREAEGGVYAEQIERMSAIDPISAVDYMAQNRDKLSPNDLVSLEARLIPEAKRARGREAGQRAYSGGSIDQAIRLASTTLGMNENEQQEALAQYMADGGVNLDPAVTAWCAAWVNATLAQAGFEGTGSNMARSFLNWGVPVTTPKRGDLVVLERGEPPYGHVGFFDGRNEDGTIRILGGNQGDSVSVASYRSSQVLGFRRAPEGSDLGMSALLEIEDPVEREAAIREYSLRAEVATGQQEQQAAVAAQSAYEMVTGGMDPMDLSPSQRSMLGRTELQGLISLHNTLSANEAVQTDPAEYVRLMEMYSNPRQRDNFLAEKPLEWAGKLSAGDWEQMVNRQAEVRKGTASSAPSVSTTMSIADSYVADVFDKGSEEYNQFKTRLVRWREANPDAPDSELIQEIQRSLVPIALNPVGLKRSGPLGFLWDSGKFNGRAFQLDVEGDPLDPSDDLLPEDLRDGRLSVNGKTVSNQMIDDFALGFEQRYGRAPTVQEFLDAVTGSGLF